MCWCIRTPPLAHPVEVMGPVTVTLYLSSDRKDTDLTIKLIDVDPAGGRTTWTRASSACAGGTGGTTRCSCSPARSTKWSSAPLTTGNAFAAGHRIRVEVSSSNFPHFERNLNTGGNNYDEKDPLVAHNVIHHGPQYPSSIVLPVVSAPATASVEAAGSAARD